MKLKLATTIIATLTFAVVFAQSPVTVITTDGLKISGTIIQRGEDFIRIKLSEGVTRIIYNNTITSIDETRANSISFTSIPSKMKPGETRKAVAEACPEEAGYKISFASSNPEVATIDANGLIRAISSGETTITAKTDNVKCSQSIIVVSKDDPEEKIKYDTTKNVKPSKKPKPARIFEPVKKRFEMSAEVATSIAFGQINKQLGNVSFGYINIAPTLIMGYRFNQTLFIGGGIGVSYQCGKTYDTDYGGENIRAIIPVLDANIFVTARTYFSKKLTEKKVSPFAALSFGGHFSESSGLLVNPQIGINIRTREHKNNSLYISFGFNGQTIKYEEITRTWFDDRDYHTNINKGNKFVSGFDIHIGYTF